MLSALSNSNSPTCDRKRFESYFERVKIERAFIAIGRVAAEAIVPIHSKKREGAAAVQASHAPLAALPEETIPKLPLGKSHRLRRQPGPRSP